MPLNYCWPSVDVIQPNDSSFFFRIEYCRRIHRLGNVSIYFRACLVKAREIWDLSRAWAWSGRQSNQPPSTLDSMFIPIGGMASSFTPIMVVSSLCELLRLNEQLHWFTGASWDHGLRVLLSVNLLSSADRAVLERAGYFFVYQAVALSSRPSPRVMGPHSSSPPERDELEGPRPPTRWRPGRWSPRGLVALLLTSL